MKKLLCIPLLLLALNGFGQYSTYQYNLQLINPGYTGINGFDFTTSGRLQWYEVEGYPSNFNTSFSIPLNNINSGIGFSAKYYSVGSFSIESWNLQYSYLLKMGKGKLGIGISPGLVKYTIDFDKTSFSKDGDPAIGSSKPSITLFDFGAGLFYSNKKLSVGFSSQKITRPLHFYRTSRIYNLTGSYKINIGGNITTEPSLLLQLFGNYPVLNVSNIFTINNAVIIGLGLRENSAIIPMMGFKISNLFLCVYSYDLYTTTRSFGSAHELTIKVSFKSKSDETPSPNQ